MSKKKSMNRRKNRGKVRFLKMRLKMKYIKKKINNSFLFVTQDEQIVSSESDRKEQNLNEYDDLIL